MAQFPNIQGNMYASNYILNIVEIQNTVNSASGLTPIEQVQAEVNLLNQMVNYEQKRIFTNVISRFDQTPIQITDDINLCNATIFQNGVVFTGGAGTTPEGGIVISSGGTAILLTSSITADQAAITFAVGFRDVFTFDGLGRALYFDPSGTGNRFWVSSATLIADNLQVGGAQGAGYSFVDTTGTGVGKWSRLSTLEANETFVSLSSSGVFFQTGSGLSNAGRIDSNRNWYLGAPAISGNNDLVASNDVTVVGGRLRYQGAGIPIPGASLVVTDSLGNIGYSTMGGGAGLSSFVVGDQIQSGAMSAQANGAGSFVGFYNGAAELARFTGSGRLGISNVNPQTTLDVGGNTILRGSLQLSNTDAATGKVITATGASGTSKWAYPTELFSTGSSARFALQPNSNFFQVFLGTGYEQIRLSTNRGLFGVQGTYDLDLSGQIAATAFASHSPLRFLIGLNGTEVGRFTDSGNFGIGVSNPTFKLQVAGSQSNTGSLFLGSNLTVVGNILTNGVYSGNGSNITNIQPLNVGAGSNRLDVFQTQTRNDITSLKIGISTISTSFGSTLAYLEDFTNSAVFSTLSSAIGPGAAAQISSFSTAIDATFRAQFSTLSSYIIENTSQFSTLSSILSETSSNDRIYASSIAFSTASTLIGINQSTLLGGGFAIGRDEKAGIAALEISGNLLLDKDARVWISSGGAIGVGYKEGQDLSGSIDVAGLVFAAGYRGLSTPLTFGVGPSTTMNLIGQGYTSNQGWRLNVVGDVDISGFLFRNGLPYTMEGVPDFYWQKNGSNIYYNDGNVGIGVLSPSYPLDVAGRIRCFGVDVIPGPGPGISTPQGQYVSPWQYAGSNIYYNLGGVGIGTGVSSVQNGIFLDVSGNARFRNGTTYFDTTVGGVAIGKPYGDSLNGLLDVSGLLWSHILQVSTTGLFGGRVTARDFLSLSDRRLKMDVLSIPNALETVARVRGVQYKWKDTGVPDLGMIAQEVREVYPEAVGGDEEAGYTIAYTKLVGVLWEAVKELKGRVEILERKGGGEK
jgi:hypothetical protein